MRTYLVPIAVLLGILGLSLWNGTHSTGEVLRWQDQLQQAEALAQSGSWDDALEALTASYEDWSQRQTYLHVVAEHDTVDDAEAMYRRSMAFAATRELSEFRAEVSDLRDQLRLLSEMEHLDVKNIL